MLKLEFGVCPFIPHPNFCSAGVQFGVVVQGCTIQALGLWGRRLRFLSDCKTDHGPKRGTAASLPSVKMCHEKPRYGQQCKLYPGANNDLAGDDDGDRK